jgi:type III restriction enzyme
MEFKFKTQQFQTDAVENIVRVFNGQPKQDRVTFSRAIGRTPKKTAGTADDLLDVESDETGYSNGALTLTDRQLLENIRKVQQESNIKLSSELIKGVGAVSLDVEMETGTGKTYVYIKTMFELHRHYGWSKYIVVVPSIAIREGVKKTFEITQEHFMRDPMYGIKARFFVYDSSDLHQLDDFSSGFGINVMIINIQAFARSLKEGGKSKESLIIYSKRDEFASRRPIDVIRANRPIIILDEPQKMEGDVTQHALKNNFDPLFSLNYSATHKTSHNLVYVLDALDAFKKELVKKIEVKGFDIKNLHGTDRYIYLERIVITPKKPPRVRIEFEVKHKTGIKRETHLFEEGDSLYARSKELEQYKGISIANINPIQRLVTFSNGDTLTVGKASGNVDEKTIRRIQIRETIASHFEKEEQLFQSGIKCLSLFFIDEVGKYRQYDENGVKLLGEYGTIFEEEYVAALNERLPSFPNEYQTYLRKYDVKTVHNGYFSIDKQGRDVDSVIKRGNEFSDDISAYDLILSKKERLLSFDESTRFIFSHSALREGWDNPNVFQICTLKHSDNAATKRQEVGRGLRLCVNQFGDRQDEEALGKGLVQKVNKLTVIASESYAGFVSDLQSKIREDLYERPLKVAKEYFVGKAIKVDEGTIVTLDERQARIIYQYLIKNDYIDEDDDITNTYREADEYGTLAKLPEELMPLSDGIHNLVRRIFSASVIDQMIEDGHETKIMENPLNDNFYKQEFQELWKAINCRYAYTVEFDSQELIEKSIVALNTNLYVTRLLYTLTKGIQTGTEFEVSVAERHTLEHSESGLVRYDVIGKIAEGAMLTRRSANAIFSGLQPKQRAMFGSNPEEFIQKVVDEINKQKAAVVVEHILYQPSAEEPYTQDIFNMSKSSQEYANAFVAKRAIQKYVFTDGISDDKSVERTFVKDLDVADEVVVYAKLPRGPKGFYIPTPVGNYSPDWAIAFRRGSVKHIFFIAETKGSMNSLDLKAIEKAKIYCAKKLFNEISTTGVKYHEVDSYQKLLDVMQTL